jgi:hypothetical protein
LQACLFGARHQVVNRPLGAVDIAVDVLIEQTPQVGIDLSGFSGILMLFSEPDHRQGIRLQGISR